MQSRGNDTHRKNESSEGRVKEINTPSHSNHNQQVPQFEINNTNRTTSLIYQSGEYVHSKMSNKQSTRFQNPTMIAKVVNFDHPVKLNLNADVNYDNSVSNLPNFNSQLSSQNGVAVISVQDLMEVQSNQKLNMYQSQPRADFSVNVRDRSKTKLTERGTVIVAHAPNGGSHHQRTDDLLRKHQPFGSTGFRANTGYAHRRSQSRESTTSNTQYFLDMRSHSNQANRILAGGQTQVIKLSGTENGAFAGFSHDGDSPKSGALDQIENLQHFRNSFVQASRCQSKRQSEANVGQQVARGQQKNQVRAATSGLNNLGFGSRYGSRMRKKYHEKFNQKIQKIHQAQQSINMLSSMQSIGKSNVMSEHLDVEKVKYRKDDKKYGNMNDFSSAQLSNNYQSGNGEVPNQIIDSFVSQSKPPTGKQMVSHDTQTYAYDHSPSLRSAASSHPGHSMLNLYSGQALMQGWRDDVITHLNSPSSKGIMSQMRQSSAEQSKSSKAMRFNGLSAAPKNALFSSQTALETNKIVTMNRQQQLYKLPIIKILEMDKLRKEQEELNNKRHTGAKSISTMLANSQRRGRNDINMTGSKMTTPFFEVKHARNNSNFENRRKSSIASKGDNAYRSSFNSKRKSQHQGKGSSLHKTHRSMVSELFMQRAEAVKRGQVLRFVESAMQNKVGSILQPKDQTFTLMKDLWKMENAMNYLSATNEKYNIPNDYDLDGKTANLDQKENQSSPLDVKALIKVSSKRKQLLVTRSYSSNLNEPSTIAAMISKPDSGTTKENDRIHDTQNTQNTQESQLKALNTEEHKQEQSQAEKAGMSQHGQDDEQKNETLVTLNLRNSKVKDKSATADRGKPLLLPAKFDIIASPSSERKAAFSKHKSGEITLDQLQSVTSSKLADPSAIKSKSKSKEEINIHMDFQKSVLIEKQHKTKQSNIMLIDDKDQTQKEKDQIEKEINNIQLLTHIMSPVSKLETEPFQNTFQAISPQSFQANRGSPPLQTSQMKSYENLIASIADQNRNQGMTFKIQAIKKSNNSQMDQIKQKKKSVDELSSEIIQKLPSKQFNHTKNPFKHQKAGSRAQTSQDKGRGVSRNQQLSLNSQQTRLSLLQSKLQASTDRDIVNQYKISQENVNFLRKFIGEQKNRSKSNMQKQEKSKSQNQRSHTEENEISTKQEVEELFRKINLDSQTTAAMFGPDRGRENPMISQLQNQNFLNIDSKNAIQKKPPASNKTKARERPMLADVLTVQQSHRDQSMPQNTPHDIQIKHNSINSKRLSQKTSNSAVVTQINEATRSASTHFHSLVEWPTFGSTKEEDELLQLWRQAYAVVDEAISGNDQSATFKKDHFFKMGKETIRIPNGLPTSQQQDSSQKQNRFQLGEQKNSKLSSGAETLGCEVGTIQNSQEKINDSSQAKATDRIKFKHANPSDLAILPEQQSQISPECSLKTNSKQVDDSPLKTDKDGRSNVQPSPDYLQNAMIGNEANSAAQQFLINNNSSVSNQVSQEQISRNETDFQGTFRLSKDIAAATQKFLPSNEQEQQNPQIISKTFQMSPLKTDTDQDKVRDEKHAITSSQSKPELPLSKDTEDVTSSQHALYAVQIETIKKYGDNENSNILSSSNPGTNRKIGLQENTDRKDNTQRNQQDIAKELAEYQAIGPLQSKRVMIYQRPQIQSKTGTTPQKDKAKGMYMIESQKESSTAQDLTPQTEPLVQKSFQLPIGIPKKPTTQLAMHNGSIQQLQTEAIQQAPSQLRKLHYILQTFDKQKHEFQEQLHDYQGIEIEGKSYKPSKKEQNAQDLQIGDDTSFRKNFQLSKCVNTHSLSDSLMAESSPPQWLEPKVLAAIKAQGSPHAKQWAPVTAIKQFEVYPPRSLHVALQHQNNNIGKTANTRSPSGTLKQIVYQHGQKTSSWLASSKHIEASVNTTERPKSNSIKSGMKNQQEITSHPKIQQDSNSVGGGKRNANLSATEEQDDEIIVKDQSQQLSNSALPVLTGSTPTQKVLTKKAHDEMGNFSENSKETKERMHLLKNPSMEGDQSGAKMSRVSSIPNNDQEDSQISPDRRQSLPDEPMVSKLQEQDLKVRNSQVIQSGQNLNLIINENNIKEQPIDSLNVQKDPVPSDVSLALSPHLLEHRLQQQSEDIIKTNRQQLEAIILQSSVRVTSKDGTNHHEIGTFGTQPNRHATTSNGLSDQTRHDDGQVGPKWLFPTNLINGQKEQIQLLQMVQRYKKKVPKSLVNSQMSQKN